MLQAVMSWVAETLASRMDQALCLGHGECNSRFMYIQAHVFGKLFSGLPPQLRR